MNNTQYKVPTELEDLQASLKELAAHRKENKYYTVSSNTTNPIL